MNLIRDVNPVAKLLGLLLMTTPLLLSISGGTPDIAELLIEKGADLSASRRDGETPLSLARKLGDRKLVVLIEEKIGVSTL